jgi:hypothetical protein
MLPVSRDNSIFCINFRNYIASMSHRGKDTSLLTTNVCSHVATSSKNITKQGPRKGLRS